RLKLGNQADVLLLAKRRESTRAFFRNWICTVSQLGMRLEREVVIDFEDDDVNSLLRECRQRLSERVEVGVSIVVKQMHRPPRFRRLRTCGECGPGAENHDENCDR